MATSSHEPPHQEQHLHDSEYTSDSSDEFASASEGDDDLPWEPVVIRSPMVSRQSPLLVQTTSTSTRSRSTPKLRERVRQSPVLHSRIVRAYLDPNASSAYQHASPEFVREAWLQEHQETHRESSEEDEEEEKHRQDPLPDQRVPSLTPLQSYHHPAPVPITAPAAAPSYDIPPMNAAQSDLLEANDSWGFDDTLDIGQVAQEDQEESCRAFDGPMVVPDSAPPAQFSAVVRDVHSPESTTTSMIPQNYELDLEDEDAWGGDDQLMDLVEAEIQSTFAPHPVVQAEEEMEEDEAEVQLNEQDDWNRQQYDDEHVSAQEHESMDEFERAPGGQQLHQTNVSDEEIIQSDQNPFISPEDIHHQGQGVDSDLHQSSAHDNHPGDNSRLEDIASVELLDQLGPEAAWHEDEASEQSLAHEVLHHPTVNENLEMDTQQESEATSRRDTHAAPLQESHSKEEMSTGSDVEEAEASWGFDMDQVIDIEAYPIEEAPSPQMGLHDDSHHSADNVEQHHSQGLETAQVNATQSLPEARDAPSPQTSFQIDHSSVAPEQVLHQNAQGSDDENDSEVREIMQAAQHNPFIGSDECPQTGQSSVALSSIISDNELAMGNEDGRTSADVAQPTHSHGEASFLDNAPVVSHLSIMQDTPPEPLESASLNTAYEQQESSKVAQDLGGVASDSEGSDIYGDLSTARSGINASSNRLNEILDDDDYLEHMERGVPMNRSISTPYSDDESPKFIVEDEIVELMERGEPRRLDAASLELRDDLDDNTSLAASHTRSPSPALADVVNLDIPSPTAAQGDRVESLRPEAEAPEESSAAIAAEEKDAAIYTLEPAAPTSAPLGILETTPCIDVSNSAEKPFMAPLVREEAQPVEVLDMEASDDQDPANPFSDAAAVDTEGDSWPVAVQPMGTQPLHQSGGIDQRNADEAQSVVDEAAHQDSWPEASLAEGHLDADVQEDDAWAEQDLDIVVETAPPVSLPSHTETLRLTESDVIGSESLVTGDPGDQTTLETPKSTEPTHSLQADVEEDAEEDARGDYAHHLVDDISSAVEAGGSPMLEMTHTPMQSSTLIQHDVQMDDHVDEFQKHYSPLLPAHVADDQVSESAWSGNHDVDTVAAVVEEDDAWSGHDEISGLETPLDHLQADKTEVPSISAGTKETPVTQEPSFAVVSQIADAIHDAQLDSSFSGHSVEERCSETTELGGVIDEALVEGDGWGDHDEQFIAESRPADAGLFKPEIESELPVEADEPDQQPDLSTTHASFEHSNIVDNWSEEDAWNDEDIDLTDASSLAPKQEAGAPAAIGEHEDDHTNSRIAESTTTMAFGAPNIIGDTDVQPSMDTAIDHDAWNDQDLHIDVIDESRTVETAEDDAQVEIGNAIHSDLREDLWSDHDLSVQDSEVSGPDLRTTGTENNEGHQETGDHEVMGSVPEYYDPFTDASEEAQPKSTESAVSHTSEPTSAHSGAQFVDDTLLDSALDEDAWGDQDVDIEADLADDAFIPPHAVQPAHVDKVQDECPVVVVKNEARPSSILRVGSIIHQTASDQPEEVVEDAWGWDEDEVGVHLEVEKETPPPSTEEVMALADDSSASSPTEQKMDKQQFSYHEHADAEAKAEFASEDATSSLQETAHSLLPAHGATVTADRLSPLAIHKEGVISGTDSGEGDEDSTNASQSPWQDVSPASVSKRSEAGMSVGSEFESEYSIQSLDDDEHASSTQAESKTPVETSMSWTSLHTDGWQSDTHGSSGDLHSEDKSDQQAPSEEPEHKSSQPALEMQDLPDISGADSWDFDQDDNDDLQSDLMAFKQEHSPAISRTGSTRDLKTPDMDEYPVFAQQTSSTGSLPVSPSQPHTPSTPSAAATTANEVEDDSHLPLAIRQQRARLAAKGKPLPPISKYNSVKDVGATADQTLSPRLSAATSPVAAFASPAKSPLSPMLKATSPSTPAALSSPPATAYLSPALQKQRERLEQKRAAAAAAAATPLSAARRLTVTEAPKVFSSQLHGKPTSPLLSNTTLPSALKSTLGSPTLAKKTVTLAGPSEPLSPLASPSSLGEESMHLSSRRRGSSAAPTPSSPLAEGFVRRSKDGSRPNIKPVAGFASDTVVRTSQSDSHRHGSWLSNSSAPSGWDETFDDHEDPTERDSGFKVSTNVADKDRKEPLLPSSVSSSSFYQQTVPGLDDHDHYGTKTSKTTAATTTTVTPTPLTSSYLSSKKADDYDAYGPMARKKSAKSKSSMEDSTGTAMADPSNETLIGGSTLPSKTNVSLLSPTFATSMSHRHDHHHGQHSSSSSTMTGGGFFAGGSNSNSLVGDISTILSEKATSQSNRYEADDLHKKPPSSNLQKSSSWSFGSWVSSAVAVASEKIDKAYETLDPEYSRMKTRGGGSSSSSSMAMDDGLPDPESTSPFKKPGYVVGGSSLALGLASISTAGPSAGSSQAPQQHHASPPSASMNTAGLGFGSRGCLGSHGSGTGGYAGSDSRAQQQPESHAPEQRMPDWEREREQATAPRLTRKNVSGR
ncbi:hypothetical protein BGZ70_007026 [Mortierella alpina]|uniref:Uncharacterized protein n=1 Tax=Mortierella alpina TaxID=64518 RepID=A0A9P6M3D0_MORAP|nr:hypothetical protein BGZ70_007026 [Mortierella alpina]